MTLVTANGPVIVAGTAAADTTAGTITGTSNDGNISTPNMGRLNWTVKYE
jgi:hypothetical protein